jgi:molybdenum cofactor guanylyltransferase
MGTDKRLLPVDGEPMLRRVAGTVSAVTDDLIVVVTEDRPLPPGLLEGLSARVVADRRPDAGPLAGLEAGLDAARGDLVLAVAGDMPWLEAPTLDGLLDRLAAGGADAVAVATGGALEPLLAAYRRGPALAAATALLDGGERRARALLETLLVATVEDPGGRSAANVNTPADLAAARR